jgi:hypothetical protein
MKFVCSQDIAVGLLGSYCRVDLQVCVCVKV